MITVTKGQWFPLTIGNISYAGAAFDLQGATEVSVSLVSTLGVKSPLNFEISAFNDISAVCDGTLSVGKYGIEVSCKGADGKAYRMKSPGAIIEVSSSTTSSTGNTAVRVAGDEWELTADVEMHEGQARTYMSLLEEARKAAIKAADDAEAVIDNVQSSVTQAQEAAKSAQQASTNAEDAVTKANNAVSDANNALQSITTMEGTVNTAEQGRKDAENERVTAENARVAAENKRTQSEQSREAAETARVKTEQGRAEVENARKEAESARETAENSRDTAEAKRTSAEMERQSAEDARKEAEAERVTAENGRSDAESRRQDNESVRVTAEAARVTAETEREQGFTEKAAHLDELLQYIKDNHLEPDAKLAEAIKNTINGTDEFVYLDSSDGNVKSQPNTNQLGANVAAVFYAGKRSIGLGEECQMFSANNTLVRNLDLSGWDFEAATIMSKFLIGARALRTLTLPDNMTLSNVTSMYCCFYDCSSLQSIDMSKCTLSNVTSMLQCFSGCSSLQSIDTSKWTLENVTSMEYCFYGCSSLQSIDMSKCTLENVTSMTQCFFGCSSLQSIDMSKCTLENVTSMEVCFYGCTNLREIDLSSCNITQCINWVQWIDNCFALETLKIGLIDFSLCGAVDFLSGTNIRELTGTLKGIKNNFTAKSNRMTRDSCMVVINGLETVTEAKTLTLGANNKPVSLGGKGNDPISDDDLKVATDKGWTVQFA